MTECLKCPSSYEETKVRPNMVCGNGRQIVFTLLCACLQHFMPLVRLGCSPDLHLFLCQAFVPECTDQTQVLQPCREQCRRVLSDCTRDMKTFDLTWPPELHCDGLVILFLRRKALPQHVRCFLAKLYFFLPIFQNCIINI